MIKRRAVFDLFLISALGLFIELIFIRWVASELRVVAFYKNFALIAAFLGLGLGFAYRQRSPEKRLFERYFFPLLAVSVILVLVLGRTTLSEIIMLNRANSQEYLWAGTIDIQNSMVNTFLDVAFYAFIFFLYMLITLLFVPVGELTARKFAEFKPLPGYTINVLGSLTGILLYTLISFLGWPPALWYLLAAVAGIYFLWSVERWQLALSVVLAALPILLTVLWPTGADRTVWSPYYRIDITAKYAALEPDVQLGYELAVNKAWHQHMWDLSPEFVAEHENHASEHFINYLTKYDSPFSVAPRLDEVLIVGAGTGNDVAAALRADAGHVTAVEIDPFILRIGRDMHPNEPYVDTERVTQVATDARSFFRSDDQQYDLIVFGHLDSHTLFSTASSVRLDNFVYTEESLREVRDLLVEDGLLALSFGVPPGNEWLGLRIYRTLTDVFGYPPLVYEMPGGNIIFLIGLEEHSAPSINDPNITPRPDYDYRQDLNKVTDDWPYLYLQGRVIPSTYLIGLVGVVLISLLLIRRVIPDFRQLNMHFFFLGAAFFLLETKSITEMALLLGSTWIVNAVVIAAILVMIVIANLIVARFRLTNPNPFYMLLFAALLLNYFVPISSYLGLPLTWRIILASIAQAIPLFFAGMIFAITFSKTKSIENALGSNLMGAVLGGIFEYGSLVLGIRSLYLLALLFYVLSALALRRTRARMAKTASV